MSGRRIALAVIVAVAVIAGLLALAFRAELGVFAMTRGAAHRLSARPIDDLPDGLHVGLCGAGSPLPDAQRSGPCTVVIAGKRMFLFDAGSGSARALSRMGFNPGDIEALFLTHFHSDHIDGLGEVMLQRWAGGSRSEPLTVFGPTGVDRVVGGFDAAYALDRDYRVAHHGPEVVPPAGFGGTPHAFAVSGPDARVVLVDEPDLQIVAFAVDHSPVHPAVGYRIRYKDRTAVLSGDTRKSANVQREAQGVDLLVHEGLSPRLVAVLQEGAAKAGRRNLERVFHDIPSYHTTPEEAAAIAQAAGVGFLLINHVVPALPLPAAEAAFLGDSREIFHGQLRVGVDGDFVSLPVQTHAIDFTNLHY